MSYSNILHVIERDEELTGQGRYRRGRDHNSLVVDTHKNTWFWNSRGQAGGVEEWLKLHGHAGEVSDADREKLQRQQANAQARELQAQAAARERIAAMGSRADYYHSHVDKAREYYHAQGLTDETIERYNLGFAAPCPTCRQTQSYAIPYYQNGELVSIRHRLVKEIGGKYRPEFAGLPVQIFNLDRLHRRDGITAPNEVVIVEGEIKAMVLDQAGLRVIGLPGANTWPKLIEQLRAELKNFRVYIAFDPGAEKAAAALAAALPQATVRTPQGKPDDLLVLENWNPARLYQHITRRTPGKTETLPNGTMVTRRPQDREAKAAALQARAAELEKRYQAGDKVAFLGDDPIDPDYIEYKRAQFSSAAKWRDYVLAHWPDLDAHEQYHIKLQENREARPSHCGEYRKFTLGNGQVITKRWTCGVCEQCQKRNVYTLRRALNEIQGFPVEGKLLDLDQEPEPNAGENAPPLAIVHGDFSLTRVDSEPDRLKFARDLRRAGTRYKCYPVDVDGEVFYDFIHNDDTGDPLPLMANDNRLLMWIMGAEGKRASGDLVPSLDKLKMRYRAALPYEVVLPELDDAGEPVDPDIFALDLPDIGTNAILPAVLVDFPVFDRDSLQNALYEINREQMRILNRRNDVNYHVYCKKCFFTRYSTLPLMIAEFNARQDEIRQKQRAE